MLAENFYNLFSGLDRAYGRYDLDTDQSGVKRSGTARTIAEKLTLQQWELHLEGKQGLGVVPIRDDAKVLWGAIDIDEYDLDVDTLSKSLGTSPFIPCLTKSGGIHLYVFFKKATSAKLVVNKLREITSALGKPSAEIFPKQIKLVTDRGDVGNWINMPYFGGKRTTRYAIYNGEHITNPEDFLKLADIRKIDSIDEIKIPQLKESEQKLEAVYKKVSSFNHKEFLEGAKKAFEIIITAFNKGDKSTLKNLVSKDVYNAFEGAINSGSNNPNSQFYSLVIDGVEDAKVEGGKISIAVNFTSEQILSDNEDSIIKNKDTWVFEKPESSAGPAWLLVST